MKPIRSVTLEEGGNGNSIARSMNEAKKIAPPVMGKPSKSLLRPFGNAFLFAKRFALNRASRNIPLITYAPQNANAMVIYVEVTPK